MFAAALVAAVVLTLVVQILVTVMLALVMRVVFIVLVILMMGLGVEIGSTLMWMELMRLMLRLVQGCVVHIVMLNTVDRRVLQVVEKLIELVLDLVHESCALMPLDIVFKGVALMRVMRLVVHAFVEILTADVVIAGVLQLEVTLVGVLRSIVILVSVSDVGVLVMSPVIWAVLNSMRVMVLIDVLWVVFAIVTVRVVVAKVVVALRLDIVVLTMLFTSEMTFITEMRHMVLQVPVSLLEVSIWVVLESVDELSHVRFFVGVGMLVWSLLVVHVILRSEVLNIVLSEFKTKIQVS